MNSPPVPARPAPPLSTALLSHIAADWPEFAEIRAAASALSHKQRLAQSVSAVVNELRVAFAGALLCTRDAQLYNPLSPEDAARNEQTIAHALRLHGHSTPALTSTIIQSPILTQT